MFDHQFPLPAREAKPPTRGLTMVIDRGLPSGDLEDAIASADPLIDYVKFGCGTALVTRLDLRVNLGNVNADDVLGLEELSGRCSPRLVGNAHSG
jgi:phosphosulfolactate synthase (CoM biosynthesis protein A)